MSDPRPTRFDAAVIGGGFAGMAAAVALSQAGRRVILLEMRRELGGRVHSHRDPGTGDVIDNGPHLLMGCYHHTRRLLRAIGTESRLRFQPRLELLMRDERGEIALRRARLPGAMVRSASRKTSIGRESIRVASAASRVWSS